MGQPAGKTNPTLSAEPAKTNPAGSVDRKNDIGSADDGAIKAAVVPGAQWKGACRNNNCAVGGVVLINHTYAAFRESPSSRKMPASTGATRSHDRLQELFEKFR